MLHEKSNTAKGFGYHCTSEDRTTGFRTFFPNFPFALKECSMLKSITKSVNFQAGKVLRSIITASYNTNLRLQTAGIWIVLRILDKIIRL